MNNFIIYELEAAENAVSDYVDEWECKFVWSEHVISCSGPFDIHIADNNLEHSLVTIYGSNFLVEVRTTKEHAKITVQGLNGRHTKTINDWTDLDIQRYLNKLFIKGELPAINKPKQTSPKEDKYKRSTLEDVQKAQQQAPKRKHIYDKFIAFFKR